MKVVGPDFPKCPVCGKETRSISLDEVPQRTRQEMVRYNRYQKLDPNYWYKCEEDNIIFHKLAIRQK